MIKKYIANTTKKAIFELNLPCKYVKKLAKNYLKNYKLFCGDVDRLKSLLRDIQTKKESFCEMDTDILQDTLRCVEGYSDSQGLTLLMRACIIEDYELLKLLLGIGVGDIPNKKGETALNLVVARGSTEMVQIFLDSGLKPNEGIEGGGRENALLLALKKERWDFIPLLLRNMNPAKACIELARRVCLCLDKTSQETASRQLNILVELGVKINLDNATELVEGFGESVQGFGQLVLIKAAVLGRADLIDTLFEIGFRDVPLKTGETALCAAVDRGQLNIVQQLFVKQEYRATDFKGWNPLHHAARCGNPEGVNVVVDYFKDKISALMHPANDGRGNIMTPLGIAKSLKHRNVVKILVSVGDKFFKQGLEKLIWITIEGLSLKNKENIKEMDQAWKTYSDEIDSKWESTLKGFFKGEDLKMVKAALGVEVEAGRRRKWPGLKSLLKRRRRAKPVSQESSKEIEQPPEVLRAKFVENVVEEVFGDKCCAIYSNHDRLCPATWDKDGNVSGFVSFGAIRDMVESSKGNTAAFSLLNPMTREPLTPDNLKVDWDLHAEKLEEVKAKLTKPTIGDDDALTAVPSVLPTSAPSVLLASCREERLIGSGESFC